MSDTPRPRQVFYGGFRYVDAHAAIEWLQKAFGFTVNVVHPGPGDTVAHAQLEYDGALFMLGSSGRSDSTWPPRSPLETGGITTAGLYVAVDAGAIDAHYARAKAAGARIIDEIHDTDYGSRDYSAYDCEGHPWAFGTYRP